MLYYLSFTELFGKQRVGGRKKPTLIFSGQPRETHVLSSNPNLKLPYLNKFNSSTENATIVIPQFVLK